MYRAKMPARLRARRTKQCSVWAAIIDKKEVWSCRRWVGQGGCPDVQRGGGRPATGRSTAQMVQRLRRCGALQVRALRVALLHAQVLCGAHRDALPQVCGLRVEGL